MSRNQRGTSIKYHTPLLELLF